MKKNSPKGMLLLISGPSGTGKGTLYERLLKEDPSMSFSVSVTTRQPRLGEVDGVHYHFVTEDAYDELLRQDAFLEHASVHGHRYGTLKGPVEEAIEEGRSILLDLDPQGGLNVMRQMPDVVSVFILPPSYAVQRERLRTRNTEEPGEIDRRLKGAKDEVKQMVHYQYALINDDLDKAYDALRCRVRAEKMRTSRYLPQVAEK